MKILSDKLKYLLNNLILIFKNFLNILLCFQPCFFEFFCCFLFSIGFVALKIFVSFTLDDSITNIFRLLFGKVWYFFIAENNALLFKIFFFSWKLTCSFIHQFFCNRLLLTKLLILIIDILWNVFINFIQFILTISIKLIKRNAVTSLVFQKQCFQNVFNIFFCFCLPKILIIFLNQLINFKFYLFIFSKLLQSLEINKIFKCWCKRPKLSSKLKPLINCIFSCFFICYIIKFWQNSLS